MNYLDKRYGDLVPVRQLSNGLWRYRCERIRNGRACGNVRDLRKQVVAMYSCCAECGELARHQKGFGHKGVTLLNFVRVRSNFTPRQWRRYHEILRGRETAEDQRDAVEEVTLEAKYQLPPGVCCRLCKDKKLASHRAA